MKGDGMKTNIKIAQKTSINGQWKAVSEARQVSIPQVKSLFSHAPRLTQSKVCFVCSVSSRGVSS